MTKYAASNHNTLAKARLTASARRVVISANSASVLVNGGASFRRMLREAFGEHPHVGDIRGRGLFIGMELVNDRESKAPFDPCLLYTSPSPRDS